MLPSQSSVNDAIQDATEEINGHIGGRYPLPLPNVPSNLKRMTCDIARYRLYFQQPTEEVRQRYEDAIAFLKRVADNKAHLQIQLPETNQIVDDQPKDDFDGASRYFLYRWRIWRFYPGSNAQHEVRCLWLSQ